MADSRLLTLLGTTLRREREGRQLTQQKLAEWAGVTQAAIANIERGVRTPSVPMLERLFAALDLQLTVGVERLDAHVDAAIAELAAVPLDERIAETSIDGMMARLAGFPYVFDGPTAALLQGAPVPAAEAVDVAVAWGDADALTDWLERNYGQRWNDSYQQFGYLHADPRLPGAHRWRTIGGALRARMCDELPAAIEVRHGDRAYRVVPLAEVEIDDPHVARLLRRYRATRAPRGPGATS